MVVVIVGVVAAVVSTKDDKAPKKDVSIETQNGDTDSDDAQTADGENGDDKSQSSTDKKGSTGGLQVVDPDKVDPSEDSTDVSEFFDDDKKGNSKDDKKDDDTPATDEDSWGAFY